MIIHWLQDLHFLTSPGGAEQTDRAHFTHALKKGIKQNIIVPEMAQRVQVGEDDVFILSNVVRFPQEVLGNIRNRFIVFHHDYNFCKYRLYFPRIERCKTQSCNNGFWHNLYQFALLHVFLSPLHYSQYKVIFGEAVEPHVCVPSPVNTDEFYLTGKERGHGILSVNGLFPFKGRDNIFRWMEENGERVTFVGGGFTGDPLPDGCEFKGTVPIGKMNEVYNAHESFIHLPQSPSPFDRTVVEAYLAGCKLILNRNVGSISYPWFTSRERVREEISRSSELFWKAIEEVI